MTTPTAAAGSDKFFAPRVTPTSSVASSVAEEKPCSVWCGRAVKSCLLCCFSPCITLCSCKSKVTPEPTSAHTAFLSKFSALKAKDTNFQAQVTKIVETYLRENPSQLKEDVLGLGSRDDIRQAVQTLDLSGVNLDDSSTSSLVAVSCAVKIDNLCKTFPNLTDLNLADTGIGRPQKGQSFHNSQQGRYVHVDLAGDCLNAIAVNCGKLVNLTLSKNAITEGSLLKLTPLKGLKMLTLHGCRRVTPVGVNRLYVELPDLTILYQPPKSARHRTTKPESAKPERAEPERAEPESLSLAVLSLD